MEIVTATLVVGVIGFALVFARQKFHVEVDEREAAVRSALPGNNCGACAQKCPAKVISGWDVKIKVAAS